MPHHESIYTELAINVCLTFYILKLGSMNIVESFLWHNYYKAEDLEREHIVSLTKNDFITTLEAEVTTIDPGVDVTSIFLSSNTKLE